jgi:hypothetical protein
VFSKLTNAYCLVAIGGSENFYRFPFLSVVSLSIIYFSLSDFCFVVYIIVTLTPLLIYLFIVE